MEVLFEASSLIILRDLCLNQKTEVEGALRIVNELNMMETKRDNDVAHNRERDNAESLTQKLQRLERQLAYQSAFLMVSGGVYVDVRVPDGSRLGVAVPGACLVSDLKGFVGELTGADCSNTQVVQDEQMVGDVETVRELTKASTIHLEIRQSLVPNEYNVVNGVSGIGAELLLEVVRECVDVKDVQRIVGLNRQTAELVGHEDIGWATLPARARPYSLLEAAAKGERDIVKYRVETCGDDVNKDDHGQMPLYVASEKGDLSIVEYLANHGADVNKSPTSFYTRGQTPLYVASERGHLSVVEYLLSHGADMNKTERDGETPLHIASKRGRLSIVECLVSHKADVNQVDGHKQTPLYDAADYGRLSIVEYLMNHGADVNKADQDGRTPLYVASQEGHLSIVECLVSHGADVNKDATANYVLGQTPLHVASQEGHLSIVECLVSHGADVNRTNGCGRTPLDAASGKQHSHICEYLVEHGAK